MMVGCFVVHISVVHVICYFGLFLTFLYVSLYWALKITFFKSLEKSSWGVEVASAYQI